MTGFKHRQRVIRYMGVAGGFWEGHVIGSGGPAGCVFGLDWGPEYQCQWRTPHVHVAFGLRKRADGSDTFDVAMVLEANEHLFAYPETPVELDALREKIIAQRKLDAPLNAALDGPLWPRGYFEELEPRESPQ